MRLQKKFLYLLTFAYSASIFSTGILAPIYAFFVEKIGGGILEASWAVALYSIVTGIGTIVLFKTPWSHVYAKHFFWIGWLLWLISIWVYVGMEDVYMLYISQIVNGIGTALSQPVFDAEFSKNITKDLSGGWALFEGVTSIFSGLAAIAGGVIATWYGFEVLIYCMIFIATVSFLGIAYYTSIQKDFTESLE